MWLHAGGPSAGPCLTAFPWGPLGPPVCVHTAALLPAALPGGDSFPGALLSFCCLSASVSLSIPISESFCLSVSPSLNHSSVLYSPTHLSTPCSHYTSLHPLSATPGFSQLNSAPLETPMPALWGHRNSPTELCELLGSRFIKRGQVTRKDGGATGTGWELEVTASSPVKQG